MYPIHPELARLAQAAKEMTRERLQETPTRLASALREAVGGRHSWLATAEDHGLAGAVGFYGRPGEGRDGKPGPTARAARKASTSAGPRPNP